jgi:hypothetical protein
MKKKNSTFSMPSNHARLVDDLTKNLKPVPRLWSLGLQWVLWAVANLVILVLFLNAAHLRPDAWNPSFLSIVLLILMGAGLAAYGALESGVPGEEQKGRWKFWTAVLLWAGALGWTFMAVPWSWEAYPPVMACNSCFAIVLEIGVLCGGVLMFFLKRSAPLKPYRAGLWAGLSAFLMGLAAITLHCPSGNLFHILMEHFLPVLVYAFLVAALTAGWLSGWRRKPLNR